ncbi:MAG: 1-deoxy-D-xylulose-5-phosphate reductoisomerase [Candidatus Omnitrophica bacterium]|nr:1-deoxy-D-xylulose-5-phosphate reductoisomerase [Candidatus Omnitrophota bacterium]MCM8810863.1 1-deoxy-D-xylulose-5-phosphate reductoisomerase [Candidatus Omnitrophota bacterium]MCM8833062.1 1-deoxy-D-xylulose-5-phosphate reductoisomerase [Candidatus Omnitrophota bacterium]
MKNVIIYGSTGTIGQNALEVIRRQKDKFNVLCLACKKNQKLLIKQIEEFKPKYAYIEEKDQNLERKYKNVKFFFGEQGLIEIANLKEGDFYIFAIPGVKTLPAFIECIKNKKKIALATKEILVSGGEIIEELKKNYCFEILPIDSEHNAIFQILKYENKEINKIYLTASGGPFYGRKIKKVKIKDALKHPVWKMGKKITIDSATMMNKAFEIIEAHYLFSLNEDQIDVVIHPEAIIHGIVEFIDGTSKFVGFIPDMKLPINYVLNFPERVNSGLKYIDFSGIKRLNFKKVNKNSKWLNFAKQAIKKKGSYPVVLNGANERVVEYFLEGKIKFQDIIKYIEKVVEIHQYKEKLNIEDIFYYHNWARKQIEKIVGG